MQGTWVIDEVYFRIILPEGFFDNDFSSYVGSFNERKNFWDVTHKATSLN